MTSKLSVQDQFILTHIKEQYFNDSPILISESIEGQEVSDTKVITLGLKAGPSYLVYNLLHEMSHLVEIEDHRMTKPSWGLKYGNLIQIILGQEYQNFTSTQATEREIRVFAYQQHLLNHYQIESSLSDQAKLCTYLGDWANVCYGDKLNHHDKAKALRWVEAQIFEKMKIYTLDRFNQEWDRKQIILKNLAIDELSNKYSSL